MDHRSDCMVSSCKGGCSTYGAGLLCSSTASRAHCSDLCRDRSWPDVSLSMNLVTNWPNTLDPWYSWERDRERERENNCRWMCDSCIQLSIFQDGNYRVRWILVVAGVPKHINKMWLGTLAGVLFKKCANEALAQQLFVRTWGGK